MDLNDKFQILDAKFTIFWVIYGLTIKFYDDRFDKGEEIVELLSISTSTRTSSNLFLVKDEMKD